MTIITDQGLPQDGREAEKQGKGKKYDKRATIAKRDEARDKERAMRVR